MSYHFSSKWTYAEVASDELIDQMVIAVKANWGWPIFAASNHAEYLGWIFSCKLKECIQIGVEIETVLDAWVEDLPPKEKENFKDAVVRILAKLRVDPEYAELTAKAKRPC